MDYILKKETENFNIELSFSLETKKTTCKAYSKIDNSEVFCQDFKCTVHKYIEDFFKQNRLSKFLQKDVDENKCRIDSSFMINQSESKLMVECYLRSNKTNKIILRRAYKVRFNDLLDDIEANIDDKWFQEVCS